MGRLVLRVSRALMLVAVAVPSLAAADEIWTVEGGTTLLAIDAATLDRFGITAFDDDGASQRMTSLTIDASSTLSLTVRDGVLENASRGDVRHVGGLTLEAPDSVVRLSGFSLQPVHGSFGAFVVTDGIAGIALLESRAAKLGFDRVGGQLLMETAELTVTRALAEALGIPKLEGVVIGDLIVQAKVTWAGGDEPAPLPAFGDADAEAADGGVAGGNNGTVCHPEATPPIVGPDVIVGDLVDLSNYASLGGIEAFAVGTTSCNIGDKNLEWISGTNHHPLIAQNMFRLKNGRFEQIGQSWLKHAFTALTENACGCGCNGDGGSVLGVGCSDPYCCGLNGQQIRLGPRSDVNAFSGFYPYPYTIGWQQTGNSIYKRLQVQISDLDPAQNGGGQYYVDGQYVTADEAAWDNQHNNASYRTINVTGGGTSWTASLTGTTQREKPAVAAWKASDGTVMLTTAQVQSEGTFYIASKATDLGTGFWHYEYAVQNLNSHRSGRSFSVPISSFAVVQNIGFHDVDYHSGEPYTLTNWTPSWSPGSTTVSWSTDTFDANPNANALRWSTLYNFRFDANVPPIVTQVTIGLFRTGSPPSVTGVAHGPGTGCTLDAQCNDGMHCNGNETCNLGTGQCVAGTIVTCSDPGECRSAACDEGADACVTTNDANGSACGSSADNDCDNPDTCLNGACQSNLEPAGTACGDPSDTDCDNPDTCDDVGGCSANHAPDGSACTDEGNSCTDEACQGGECAHVADDANTCSDGLNCTLNDHCSGGSCIAEPLDCDDGLVCTLDACAEPAGNCTNTDIESILCSDDQGCPNGDCDEAAGHCVCCSCQYYGDIFPMGGDCDVNIDDILCVLDDFGGLCFGSPDFIGDIIPCGGDIPPETDLDDVLAVLEAFGDSDHDGNPCPHPCTPSP